MNVSLGDALKGLKTLNVSLGDALENLGHLFYIIRPSKTSFESIEEVPDYYVEVIPYLFLLILLEQGVLILQRKPILRFDDATCSASQGLLQEFVKIFFRGWLVFAYAYIYKNWRLFTLPWNSVWTWCITLISVDFFYYWGHRATHEINFLWASHQVHHSSEEYNLTTALRQSAFQPYIMSLFYFPMAFAVPPTLYLVHTDFNLFYQFWIHTELIQSLGPLEYIFNTASHHRVHHGRNRYCIDRNFGGVLIIWDRIFGTFEAEKEEVVYGLTHPINTFEPLYIQLFHFMNIIKTFWRTQGIKNKLSVICKGPGWAPGLPWHGRIEDVPNVKAPVKKYDPLLPLWLNLYVLLHFFILVLGFIALSKLQQEMPPVLLYSIVLFEISSLIIIGILNEGRPYAPWLELTRCFAFMVLDYCFPISALAQYVPAPFNSLLVLAVQGTFAVSLVGWLIGFITTITVKLYSNKKVE